MMNRMWYLETVEYKNGYGNTKEIYLDERNTEAWDGNKQTWDGKVALIYPSYYMYASSACYNDDTIKASDINGSYTSNTDYSSNKCMSTNWLLDTNSSYWTLSPSTKNKSSTMFVSNGAYVSNFLVYTYEWLRPSVYLNTKVNYVSGDGTKNNPFVIN